MQTEDALALIKSSDDLHKESLVVRDTVALNDSSEVAFLLKSQEPAPIVPVHAQMEEVKENEEEGKEEVAAGDAEEKSSKHTTSEQSDDDDSSEMQD